jgi:hypothetical protein
MSIGLGLVCTGLFIVGFVWGWEKRNQVLRLTGAEFVARSYEQAGYPLVERPAQPDRTHHVHNDERWKHGRCHHGLCLEPAVGYFVKDEFLLTHDPVPSTLPLIPLCTAHNDRHTRVDIETFHEHVHQIVLDLRKKALEDGIMQELDKPAPADTANYRPMDHGDWVTKNFNS